MPTGSALRKRRCRRTAAYSIFAGPAGRGDGESSPYRCLPGLGEKRTKIRSMASDSERALLLRMDGERGTEGDMRRNPKKGEGRGKKRRQSQPGRDMGGAKHETGRNWPE
ncbi:hypothetical protein TNCV_4077891 [Trichonephila clavipes]|nr:hypothetical protein TNCV_4077891 [Trichonephila clavipes]